MILIITDKFDVHADKICEKLTCNGEKFFRLNLDVESLQNTFVKYKDLSWLIVQGNQYLNLDDVTSIYPRRIFVELSLEERNNLSNGLKIWKNEWNKFLIGIYQELKVKKWLNTLSSAYRAENKYLQVKLAKQVGLNIPEFIVSNDRDELLNFFQKHQDVVLKLMAQEFYYENNQVKGFYVNKIGYEELLSFQSSRENPIVLQRYIPKLFEVRYTVVNNNHYVCKIESQKSNIANIDWRRYDIPHTPHYPITPPVEIQQKVDKLMLELDLQYGALDFIVAPDNNWYFLEINSMGQWLWIEDLTGLMISDAIVEYLSVC